MSAMDKSNDNTSERFPDLYRATIEVDVIYEADGPGHAVKYAEASIVERLRAAGNGEDVDVFTQPGRFEHNSAKARLGRVVILSQNGEVVLPGMTADGSTSDEAAIRHE